jgi:hypothetical protein
MSNYSKRRLEKSSSALDPTAPRPAQTATTASEVPGPDTSLNGPPTAPVVPQVAAPEPGDADGAGSGRAGPEPVSDDRTGRAETAAAFNPTTLTGSTLKTRIDPASIAVDWDAEGLAEDEDQAPGATWSRPPKDNFVRVHPTWTMGVFLLDCRASQGLDAEYILAREVARRVMEAGEPVTAAQVYLLIDRDGGLRYWAVKLGEAPLAQTQKPSDYVKTARAAVERARREWIKITWQSRAGFNGWRTRAAKVEIPDPVWPADPAQCFFDVVSDRWIADPQDDLIRKYLGEA